MSFTRSVALLSLSSPLLLAPAAPAAPARGATCDQIRGATEFASERWRIFRLRSSDDQSEVPRWACRRTSSPVRQLVSLPRPVQAPDDNYAYGGASAGDVVSFTTSTRSGSRTVEIDLQRRVLRTTSMSNDGRGEITRWLASGGRVSYATGPTSPAGAAEMTFGVIGDVTLSDARGTRTLGRGAALNPATGGVEQPADALVDVGGAATSGEAGVVYVRRANGTVERFESNGSAEGQGWAPSPELRVVKRRFPAPTRQQQRVTPLLGPGAQVFERADGTLSLQLTFKFGAPAVQTAATLAPGSLREARLIGENVVLGRFADDPDQLSVRSFSVSRSGAPLATSTPAPSSEILSRPNSRIVAWREGSRLVQQNGWDPGAWRATVDAPGARDLALSFDTLYYTDAAGTPRALTKPLPAPQTTQP